ncbi:hypothetical protein B0H11DRAFT_2265165 [Mycena galericulata]|nr:hypothetical protein B0H11DRAFT_2265165 [Mycena galericulata]
MPSLPARTKPGRGRKPKFSSAQLKFLDGCFENFKKAQRNRKLSKFWNRTNQSFFRAWPEEDVLGLAPIPEDDGNAEEAPGWSPEDLKRLGDAQIAAWFSNKDQKIKRSHGGVDKAGDLAARLFTNVKKRTRKLQLIEVYQKHNREKINIVLKRAARKLIAKKNEDANSDSESASDSNSSDSDDSSSSSSSDSDSSSSSSDSDSSDSSDGSSSSDSSASEGGEGGDEEPRRKKAKLSKRANGKGAAKLTRTELLRLRRSVAQKMWETEDAAEKAVVTKMYTEQSPAAPLEDDSDKDAMERTPEEIQAAIDELPAIIGEFHACIERLMGWTGVTLLGGPMPEDGDMRLTALALLPNPCFLLFLVNLCSSSLGLFDGYRYSSGVTPEGGLSLPKSLPIWDDVIAGTGQWLKRCNCTCPIASYPCKDVEEKETARELRKSRALPVPTPPAPSLDDETPEDPSATQATTPPATQAKQKKLTLKQAAAAKARAAKARAIPPSNERTWIRPPTPDAGVAASDGENNPFDETTPPDWDDNNLYNLFDDNMGGPDPDFGLPSSPGVAAVQTRTKEDDNVPIDPILTAAETPETRPVPCPAYVGAVSSPRAEVGANISPLVQAFGAVSADAAVPLTYGPSTEDASFVYRPPPTPATTTATYSIFRHSPASPSLPGYNPRPSVTSPSIASPSTPVTPHALVSPRSGAFTSIFSAGHASVARSTPRAPASPALQPATWSSPARTTGGAMVTPIKDHRPATSSPLARSPPVLGLLATAPLLSPASAAAAATAIPAAAYPTSSTSAGSSAPPATKASTLTAVSFPATATQAAKRYPESRPMRGGGGETEGAEGSMAASAVGVAGAAGVAGAPVIFMQTYADDGSVIPLPLDTPMPGSSSRATAQLRAMERERDARANAHLAPTPRHLRNPDGPSDLFITGARPPDPRPEDVLPAKRTRRPAASREMPVPLTADARQPMEDARLLKRLNESTAKQPAGSKKRSRIESGGDNDENAPPTKWGRTKS